MQTTQITTLYTLKASANEHLKNKQYSHASVYFVDIIAKLSPAFQKLETEDEVEKLIKEVKIPSHKNLALCYLKMNQNKSCVQQCEEALRVQSNCLKTLYRISKAYMNMKQYQRAQQYLKRGFAIDPNEQEIQKALAEIETAKNPVQKSQESWISLKRLIAIILYWPLLIFNTFLGIIFGAPKKNEDQESKTKNS